MNTRGLLTESIRRTLIDLIEAHEICEEELTTTARTQEEKAIKQSELENVNKQIIDYANLLENISTKVLIVGSKTSDDGVTLTVAKDIRNGVLYILDEKYEKI